jgi:hypothetical protein
LIWTERLVHKLPVIWTKDGDDYQYFLLDYGKFISLIGEEAAERAYFILKEQDAEPLGEVEVKIAFFTFKIDLRPLLRDALAEAFAEFYRVRAVNAVPAIRFRATDRDQLVVPRSCFATTEPNENDVEQQSRVSAA